jgi:hypothetical protein
MGHTNESKSTEINANLRGHHICKKSEACIFKRFKIVLDNFDVNLNQIELMP